MFQATMRDLPTKNSGFTIRKPRNAHPTRGYLLTPSLWYNVHPQMVGLGRQDPEMPMTSTTYGEFGEPTRPSDQQIQGPRYVQEI